MRGGGRGFVLGATDFSVGLNPLFVSVWRRGERVFGCLVCGSVSTEGAAMKAPSVGDWSFHFYKN